MFMAAMGALVFLPDRWNVFSGFGEIGQFIVNVGHNKFYKICNLLRCHFSSRWHAVPIFDTFSTARRSSMLRVVHNIATFVRDLKSVTIRKCHTDFLAKNTIGCNFCARQSLASRPINSTNRDVLMVPILVTNPLFLERFDGIFDIVNVSSLGSSEIDKALPAVMASTLGLIPFSSFPSEVV